MRKALIITISNIMIFLAISATNVYAGVDLPWSTTFDTSEWVQGSTLNCDGLGIHGSWTTSSGSKTTITSGANYTGGKGGRGARFYKGDGSNNCSGPFSLSFNTPQKELWIRWYMRYQAGFKWNSLSYNKLGYLYTGGSTQAIPEFCWTDQFTIYAQGGQGYSARANSGGFSTIYGTSSNGYWACFEIHLKMDTNTTNGVAEIFVNGTRIAYSTSVNYSGGEATSQLGWIKYTFAANQATPNNGTDMYVDYDDIAVSNTGYIGPLSGTKADTSAPATPTGVGVLILQ